MWILLFCICVSEAAGEAFIMLGDDEFVGPDKRLAQELTRRRALAGGDLALVSALSDNTSAQPDPPPPPSDVAAAADDSARRQIESYYNASGLRAGDSDNSTGRDFMVYQLITFLIYSAKGRLDDLQPILKKYESDERFRLGVIFCQLDLWKEDILTMFAHARRTWLRRSTDFHITYYQHILAKNIDITYTVEFLIYLLNMSKGKGQ